MGRPRVVVEFETCSRDLPHGGVFVPGLKLAELAECELVVRIPGQELSLIARAVMVTPAGCGLELVGFGAEIRAKLADLAVAATRAPPTRPPPARGVAPPTNPGTPSPVSRTATGPVTPARGVTPGSAPTRLPTPPPVGGAAPRARPTGPQPVATSAGGSSPGLPKVGASTGQTAALRPAGTPMPTAPKLGSSTGSTPSIPATPKPGTPPAKTGATGPIAVQKAPGPARTPSNTGAHTISRNATTMAAVRPPAGLRTDDDEPEMTISRPDDDDEPEMTIERADEPAESRRETRLQTAPSVVAPSFATDDAPNFAEVPDDAPNFAEVPDDAPNFAEVSDDEPQVDEPTGNSKAPTPELDESTDIHDLPPVDTAVRKLHGHDDAHDHGGVTAISKPPEDPHADHGGDTAVRKLDVDPDDLRHSDTTIGHVPDLPTDTVVRLPVADDELPALDTKVGKHADLDDGEPAFVVGSLPFEGTADEPPAIVPSTFEPAPLDTAYRAPAQRQLRPEPSIPISDYTPANRWGHVDLDDGMPRMEIPSSPAIDLEPPDELLELSDAPVIARTATPTAVRAAPSRPPTPVPTRPATAPTPAPAASPAAAPAPAPAAAEAPAEAAATGEAETTENDDELPAGATEEEKKFAKNVHERLRGLNLAQQVKLAHTGETHERIVLERMYGKTVWEALLRNPRVTGPEVARIARMGQLPRPLIEVIVTNGAWLQIPEVRRALLSNPRLGTDQILRILRLLPKHELKLAGVQTSYPSPVRDAARKLIKDHK